MAALWAAVKLAFLALAVGLMLAGAVVGGAVLAAVSVARAGGLPRRGALAVVETALSQGASSGPVVVAVGLGAVVGLWSSRAAGRRRSSSEGWR